MARGRKRVKPYKERGRHNSKPTERIMDEEHLNTCLNCTKKTCAKGICELIRRKS